MAGPHVEEAISLFTRFAERHRLTYEVGPHAEFEVLWTFPTQQALTMPIEVGLQDHDVLNFGVSDFWSLFSPFDRVAATFERVLDAWVSGDARIVAVWLGGRALQLRCDDEWITTYRARCLLPVPASPKHFITN